MRLLCGRGGGGRGQGGQGGYAGHHRHYHHYLQIHQIHNHNYHHSPHHINDQNVRSALSLFSPDCRQSGLKDKSCLQVAHTNINDLHCHYDHFDGHYNFINMSMIIIQLQPQ